MSDVLLVLLVIVGPATGMGFFLWVHFHTSPTRTVESTAIKSALVGSLLTALGWTVYVLRILSVTRRPLGIIAIPVQGIPLAIIAFAIGWAASVIVLSVAAMRSSQAWPKLSFTVALGILLLSAVCGGVYAQRALAQRAARAETSAEKLRALRNDWGHDPAVRDELASNKYTPPDLLTDLASDPDKDIRSRVAGNPGTPPAVLEQLYNEPRNRYALAVNPSTPVAMLLKLATDPDYMVRYNLMDNPSVPDDVLEQLSHDKANGQEAANVLRRRRAPAP